ncbi:hypothetical protein O5O45_23645 [Hahella aquimaris]|uniref:hypothetical protein n=1 Tax=Hahella sp. HNIBRBA332 TaxID=3015983 RepID=UPI00273C68CB|nr:hypothetical protein [Hahella sp. HNIBRBA332]WLQ12727.1 hypothetical protein O5O45_23645 [Hahella sp. HNIBRBA332]
MTDFHDIQKIFPHEQDWTALQENTLIELVRDYQSEPSCANSALVELAIRNHPQTTELSEHILDDEQADEWLKASALGSLLTKDFKRALDKSLGFIDHCDHRLLCELVEAMNYEFQGELKDYAANHATTQKLKQRLRAGADKDVDYCELFYEYVGAE